MKSFQESDPSLPSEAQGIALWTCLEPAVERIFSQYAETGMQRSKHMEDEGSTASLLTSVSRQPLC